MKTFLSAGVFAGLFLMGAVALADSDPSMSYRPTLVIQEPTNVFTPLGFDDNDNVQVVLYGALPSTCHKVGPVLYRVDESTKTVFIRNQAYFYSGCFCAQVLIPYTQVVDLGVMSRGQYAVAIERADGTMQNLAVLPIAVAKTRAPDDYLYAPVDHMHFDRNAGGKSTVKLSGIITNSCMYLKDVIVNYRSNHVIELQPVADVLTEDGCVSENRSFELTVNLREDLSGRALIHVRALNGQSLNQVVEL